MSQQTSAQPIIQVGGGASFQNAAAVSLDDSVDLPAPCAALYVGVAGDVTVNTAGGQANVTFHAVPVGVLPVACTRVWQTGTTATNLVALS